MNDPDSDNRNTSLVVGIVITLLLAILGLFPIGILRILVSSPWISGVFRQLGVSGIPEGVLCALGIGSIVVLIALGAARREKYGCLLVWLAFALTILNLGGCVRMFGDLSNIH